MKKEEMAARLARITALEEERDALESFLSHRDCGGGIYAITHDDVGNIVYCGLRREAASHLTKLGPVIDIMTRERIAAIGLMIEGIEEES